MVKSVKGTTSGALMRKIEAGEKVEEGAIRREREKSRRGERSRKGRVVLCRAPKLLFTCCYPTAKWDTLFQETHWLMASVERPLPWLPLQMFTFCRLLEANKRVRTGHVRNFPPFEPLISFAVRGLENRQIMSHTCFLHSATVPTLQSC